VTEMLLDWLAPFSTRVERSRTVAWHLGVSLWSDWGIQTTREISRMGEVVSRWNGDGVFVRGNDPHNPHRRSCPTGTYAAIKQLGRGGNVVADVASPARDVGHASESGFGCQSLSKTKGQWMRCCYRGCCGNAWTDAITAMTVVPPCPRVTVIARDRSPHAAGASS